MLPHHVGLVSETSKVSTQDLLPVAAALQVQVTRDFGPAWGVQATVAAFDTLPDVPIGYWCIIIRDDPTATIGGYHTFSSGQPVSFVYYDDNWSVSVSHECLEMLADPSGQHAVPGQSIKGDGLEVIYLAEICDPCGTRVYAVNGVLVSDFYTPHFFDSDTRPGVQYSHTGSITRPLEILPGGYLTFRDPITHEWWQASADASPRLQFKQLHPHGHQSLRESLGGQRPGDIVFPDEFMLRLQKVRDAEKRASAARANTLRASYCAPDGNSRSR